MPQSSPALVCWHEPWDPVSSRTSKSFWNLCWLWAWGKHKYIFLLATGWHCWTHRVRSYKVFRLRRKIIAFKWSFRSSIAVSEEWYVLNVNVSVELFKRIHISVKKSFCRKTSSKEVPFIFHYSNTFGSNLQNFWKHLTASRLVPYQTGRQGELKCWIFAPGFFHLWSWQFLLEELMKLLVWKGVKKIFRQHKAV